MINHCNNFIEVSLGNQEISLWKRLFGRLFGKVFLKYLESLDFDINKYPKNSKVFKKFSIQKNLKVVKMYLTVIQCISKARKGMTSIFTDILQVFFMLLQILICRIVRARIVTV